MTDRIPPHNLEAEKAVLGAVLLDNSALDEIGNLDRTDFYKQEHGQIFEAMETLHQQSLPIDSVTLGNELKNRGTLDKIGGPMALAGLTDAVATIANVEHYAQIVKNDSVKRRILGAVHSKDPTQFDEAIKHAYNVGQTNVGTATRKALNLIKPVPHKWFTEPAPELPQLLKVNGNDYLPRGTVGMIVSEGGIGKTQAMIQLAVSVATQTKWLDTFDVVKPGRSLLLLGEETEQHIHIRMRRTLDFAKAGEGDDFEKRTKQVSGLVQVAGLSGQTTATIDENGELTRFAVALRKRLEQTGPWDLIVLDPLSRWAGPDVEKDNEIATRFIEYCETLAQLPGNPVVLVCSHTSKAERAKGSNPTPRGSSALYDGARYVSAIKIDDKDEFTFVHSKHNHTPKAKEVILHNYKGLLGANPHKDGKKTKEEIPYG